MFEVIILSHGNFSHAAYETAKMIIGEKRGVRTLGLLPEDNIDDFSRLVVSTIEDCLTRGDVLVLTDIQSGSPFNATVGAMIQHRFKHITGYNLPLLIEILGACEQTDLDEIYNELLDAGKEGIVDINKLLEE